MSAQPTRWTATLSGAVRQALRLPGYPLLCAAAAGGLLGAAPHTHADNAFPAEFDLSQLLDANGGDGSEGVVIETIPNANAGLGAAAGGGDVNGDDVDDLILGAAGSSFSAYNGGQAFVLFGSRDPLPAEVELKALLTAFGGDGSEGMVLNSTYGSYYGSQNVGAGVGNVGDVNGDGIGDFLVGAPVRVFRGGSPGEGYLIYGTADGFPAEIAVPFQDVLPTVASTRINAIGEGRFGETVSSAGDVNGDGIVDLVAGAPSASQYYSQVDRSGTTLVLFGGDQNFPSAFSESDVINADGAIGAVFRGIDWAGYDGDESGTDVAGDGDINGDGLDDIVIGAPYADRGDASRAGEAYIVFGRRQGPVGPGPFDGEETLANLLPENGGDGSRGVVLSGTFANEKTGRRVSIIGDVNADGFDDIAIEFISSADSPPVRTHVVFGQAQFPATVDLAELTTTPGATPAGLQVPGSGLERAGDFNGDGVDDFLAFSNAGNGAFVVYGRTDGALTQFDLESLRPDNGGDGSAGVNFINGSSGPIAAAGDFNGDGLDDVFVGSAVVFGRSLADDGDADGFVDPVDNCPAVANPDQRDTDGDGIGNRCDADLSNNCVVNFVDLALMKAAFFSTNATADLDGDGAVNFVDLALMKAGFFAPPGPGAFLNDCNQTSRR